MNLNETGINLILTYTPLLLLAFSAGAYSLMFFSEIQIEKLKHLAICDEDKYEINHYKSLNSVLKYGLLSSLISLMLFESLLYYGFHLNVYVTILFSIVPLLITYFKYRNIPDIEQHESDSPIEGDVIYENEYGRITLIGENSFRGRWDSESDEFLNKFISEFIKLKKSVAHQAQIDKTPHQLPREALLQTIAQIEGYKVVNDPNEKDKIHNSALELAIVEIQRQLINP